MKKIVFFVEGTSEEAFLNDLLPRVLPEQVDWLVIPHEGKKDLERSFPRKLRAWHEPEVHFVVLRDKDAGDCRKLKARLREMCETSGRPDSLVRIACHELESWFLGDLEAMAKAFDLPRIVKQKNKRKFQHPDNLANAKQELQKIVPGYQKIGGARSIAPLLDLNRNRSHSFNIFLEGIRRIATNGE